MITLIVKGHALYDRLLKDVPKTMEHFASKVGHAPSYTARLIRLALLAPDIIKAILEGYQPPELTARELMLDTRFPLDWDEQR